MLTLVPQVESISYARELFPQPGTQFDHLFRLHGLEVRGKPFELDFRRYHQIEFDKRLVWVVARQLSDRKPIGYSCHWWYRDLHWCEIVGADDLWFVLPGFRKCGVGRFLKEMGHNEMRKAAVGRTGDNIRAKFSHATLMADLGFEQWGVRWVKKL